MVAQEVVRNKNIWARISQDFKEDIDKTIKQMHYLEELDRDNVVFKTQQHLLVVQKYKFFLDDIRIRISDTLFTDLNSLYEFPPKLSR